MAIHLPTPIDIYFASENAHDTNSADRCFAVDVVVRALSQRYTPDPLSTRPLLPWWREGQGDALSQSYGLEARSGFPVSRSTGTETCS
jgi:hypothetical protein